MPVKRLLLSILLLLFSLGAYSQTESRIEKLDPLAFDAKLKHIRHTLLDVRSPEEYTESCIEGAQNIHWHDRSFSEQVGKLPRYRPVYLYSNDAIDSHAAARSMLEMGFVNLVVLEGGITAWKAKRMRLEKPDTRGQ